MFKAGGYGQFLCDDSVAYDRHGRIIDREHDTFSCGHCSSVVFINARERAADIGGFCRSCARNICGPCVDADRCRPVEVLMEAIERGLEKERVRQSYAE